MKDLPHGLSYLHSGDFMSRFLIPSFVSTRLVSTQLASTQIANTPLSFARMAFAQLAILALVCAPVSGQSTGVTDTPKPPVFNVQLQTADWERMMQEVARHKGKVVVLDLWSTSCLPCMKEYPKLVAMQKHYPKDVVCLALNLDYAGIKSKPPEYYRPRIEKFLTAVKPDFKNFLCTTEANEFFDSIKLGSIPAVLVYGTDGKLAQRFDDKMLEPGEEEPFSYEQDINPFVKKLVQAAKSKQQSQSENSKTK
ncbi:MAG: hypothetical protein ABJZ55_02905 [Fuerstiella sp.]